MDTLFKFRFRISLFGRVTIGLLVLLAMGIQPTVHAQGISDPIPPGDQVVPGAFLKGSPVNNTTFPAGSAVTLAWGTSTNATNYYYCFDKTNDKNCGSIWYWNDNTDITINATGGDLEPGATYYWQVMACSSGDPKPSGCIEANGGTWWSFKVSPTVIRSTGSQDGWILESSENSGTGGQLDVNSTTLRIGDSTSDRQYLAILSFNTSSLPDDAYITSVVLKIRRSSVVGNNPFLSLGTLRTAIRKPYFGSSQSLALEDFNATASALSVGNFSQLSTYWYSTSLSATGRAYVNKTGLTQFRLYFSIDDNDNGNNDYMIFHSGNSSAGNQPQMEIKYILP